MTPEQISSVRRVLVVVALVLSLTQAAILVFGLPVLQSRPGWFWPLRDTPLPLGWLILPLGALAGLVGRRVWLEPERTGRNLAALVGLGFVWQVGFAAMSGQGVEGIRAHLVASGHAEFVAIASSDLTIREIATRYERLLDERRMVFPRSKPPGQLLFYVAVQRTSGPELGGASAAARAARFVSVATWLFPLLGSLAALPMHTLARRWLSPRLALAAVLMFLLAPGTTLITMHLDGVLYPTMASGLLLLGVLAVERRSLALAGAAGFVVFLCSYTSFSLLPVALLGLAPLFGADRPPARTIAQLGLAALGGAGLPVLGTWAALGYDPIARFRAAIAFHDQFKRLFVPGTRWDYAISNWLDFGLWVGIPLVLCWAIGTAVAFRRDLLPRRVFAPREDSEGSRAKNKQGGANTQRMRPVGRQPIGLRAKPRATRSALDAFAVLLGLLLFALAWQRGTIGETARLWLFLVPPLAIVAARGLAHLWPQRTGLALAMLLVWQAGITLLTKRYQDFF